MTTIAPDALRRFADDWENALPSAVCSGIVGDRAHAASGGYHISREDQGSGNYSVQLAEDRQGASNWASAVDMNHNAAEMALVTGRLLASARDANDPRLNYTREFYGTLDGKRVTGWDTYYNRAASSDSSHLWHVHISFLRRWANSPEATAAVLSVIRGERYSGGGPAPTPHPEPVPQPADWLTRAIGTLPETARGANNPVVRRLQGLAVAWGQGISIDGDFGPGTERAVRAIQSTAGIGVDGIVGPQTWRVLIGVCPELARGANHPVVRRVQGLLVASGRPVSIDGDFGPGTDAAVRSAQLGAGIGVDGIVGPQTWTVLIAGRRL